MIAYKLPWNRYIIRVTIVQFVLQVNIFIKKELLE